MRRALYIFGYVWMSPMTLLGFVVALFGARPHSLGPRGVLQFVVVRRTPLAWYVRRLGIAAFTLGAVIVFTDPRGMRAARLFRHEFEHVLQTSRWGPLMPFAYIGSSLWQWARGRRLYRDNPFEVRARAAERTPLP